MPYHDESTGAAIAKLTPPLSVGGATLLGFSLQDWVLVATLLYAVLQIGFLLGDRVVKPACARSRKRKRRDKED